jgi:EmrB/QacA subfamily drug resistance transporter
MATLLTSRVTRPAPASQPAPPPVPRPGWLVALTSAAFFMVALDALVVVTALPSIGRDLRTGMSTLEWTVNVYALTAAGGIITAAALGDRYGRRRVFVAGLGLFTVASAACALAPTAALLVAARAAQGLGAAAVVPLSLTILTAGFPPQRRGTVVGIWGGISGVAVAAGPLVGGAVTEGLDWHWIFWLNVPIGALVVALAVRRLPESHGPATRLDLPAVVLVGGGAGTLLWALARGTDAGWSSPGTVAGLGVAAVLLVGFVAWERRAADPMMPLRLFRSVRFSAAGATGFLMAAALFSAVFLASQYFQAVLGYSPLGTGLRFLPWTATPLVASPVAGVLCDRLGPRRVLAVGMVLQGAGLVWFGVVAGTGTGYAALVPAMVVAGTGVAMAVPTVSAAALGAVAPADAGKASGTSNTLQRLGSAFGVAVVTTVFTAAGLRPALVLAGALSVAGALTALGTATARRGNRPS